jgi:hypothetical protein
MMFEVLFCFLQTFLADAPTLAADVEMIAVTLATSVYAFIFFRYSVDSRPRERDRARTRRS